MAAGSQRCQLLAGEAIDRPLVRGPWMRRSATSALQRSSQLLSSSHEEKRRPASALRLTYFTPLSTLPLVRARYGWQARGVKP